MRQRSCLVILPRGLARTGSQNVHGSPETSECTLPSLALPPYHHLWTTKQIRRVSLVSSSPVLQVSEVDRDSLAQSRDDQIVQVEAGLATSVHSTHPPTTSFFTACVHPTRPSPGTRSKEDSFLTDKEANRTLVFLREPRLRRRPL